VESVIQRVVLGLVWALGVLPLVGQTPAAAPESPGGGAPRAEVVEAVPSPDAEPSPSPTPAPLPEPVTPVPSPLAGRDGLPTDPTLPVTVRIISPRPREIIPTTVVDVFLQVDNYLMAEEGNRLHVLVDNEPPVAWHETTRPFPLKNLNPGGHTVRVLVVRPDGSALRQPGAFAMVHFYVKRKDFQNYTDPSLPFLTVNQPAPGAVQLDANDRLCFDYWIHNVDFAAETGVKLRYKLDAYEGVLNEQGPVLWSNLQPGRHRLLVELFDATGQPIFGPFNRVEREFEVRQVLRAVPLAPETTTAPEGYLPQP
jgi:hypothetical protein